MHDKYNISENIFVSNYDKMMLNKYFPEQYYKSIDGQIAQGDSLDALGSHGGSQSLGRLAHHSFDSGATPIEGPTIIQKDTEGNSNVFAPIVHVENVNGDPSNDPNDPAYQKFMDNLQRFY